VDGVGTAESLLRELIDTAVAPGPLPARDRAITLVLRRATQLPALDAVRFVQLCETVPWPDPWIRASVLAGLTGRDDWFLDLARRSATLTSEPDLLLELQFNLQRWLFVQRQVPSLAARAEIDRLLRASHRVAAERLAAQIAPPRVQSGDVQRVAILTPQVLGLAHAPTRDALWLASGLNARGIETVVINANIWPIDSRLRLFQFSISARHADLAGLQRINLSLRGRPQLLSIFTPEPAPILDVCREVTGLLQRLQIDAVISQETQFLQDVLAAQMPLLWIATGGVVPYGRADAIWVARELLDDEAVALARSQGCRRVLPRELLFTLPEETSPIPRESLSVTQDTVLLVAVGNRFPTELDQRFVDLVTAILAAAPNATLLLAGVDTEVAALRFNGAALRPGQVRGIGHCNDLRGLFAVADIFVNPFRTGGGTSAQTAMAEGLPVVTLAMGDVGAVAGPELASPDADAFRNRLVLLIGDAEARTRESARSLARIRERFDFDKQVDEILATLRALARETGSSFEVVAAAG
jgi:glycosyltransferase involved in cell wall biosynthesis